MGFQENYRLANEDVFGFGVLYPLGGIVCGSFYFLAIDFSSQTNSSILTTVLVG